VLERGFHHGLHQSRDSLCTRGLQRYLLLQRLKQQLPQRRPCSRLRYVKSPVCFRLLCRCHATGDTLDWLVLCLLHHRRWEGDCAS
jgi:hypothetical protein